MDLQSWKTKQLTKCMVGNLPIGIHSAPLRTEWVVWHQRSLWSASRLNTFYIQTLLDRFWRLFITSSTFVEMKMSSSFKALFSFAHFRTLATPMSVCNSSANLNCSPFVCLLFLHLHVWKEKNENLTIPFPWHQWSSVDHPQPHDPPSKRTKFKHLSVAV